MPASNTGISKLGIDLLHDPTLDKSTGFTEADRDTHRYSLRPFARGCRS